MFVSVREEEVGSWEQSRDIGGAIRTRTFRFARA